MILRTSSLTLLGASAALLSLALACTDAEEPFQSTVGGSSGTGPGAGTGGTTGGASATGGTAGTASAGGSAGSPQGGTAGTQSTTGGTSGTSGAGSASGAGGSAGSGGSAGTLGGTAGTDAVGGAGGYGGGASGYGGDAGSAGLAGMSGSAGSGMAGSAGSAAIPTEHFSFFVTSVTRMQDLARAFGRGDLGFGGDLRYGEATGLAGADKICRTIAGLSMPGAENKTWRAFLSTVHGGENDGPIHAIDRIGEGPWYDRLGRTVAMTKEALLNDRPQGADQLIINDLPNEDGIPNHTDGAPGCTNNDCPDNHDTLTGTGEDGHLHSTSDWSTCFDWTNGTYDQPMSSGGKGGGGPWCGHSWPRNGSGVNWMSALAEGGCGPGINLEEMGGPQPGEYDVGTGGGYGGIYCFSLQP